RIAERWPALRQLLITHRIGSRGPVGCLHAVILQPAAPLHFARDHSGSFKRIVELDLPLGPPSVRPHSYDRLHHVNRRWIGGSLSSAYLSHNLLDFRKRTEHS